jgi:hypothetical protein
MITFKFKVVDINVGCVSIRLAQLTNIDIARLNTFTGFQTPNLTGVCVLVFCGDCHFVYIPTNKIKNKLLSA